MISILKLESCKDNQVGMILAQLEYLEEKRKDWQSV